MGLFRRREQSAEGAPRTTTVSAVLLEGDELVEVVGESHYQPAIRRVCGVSDPAQPVGHDCIAALFPEPDNRYDPDAVMVQVDGEHVGYLRREDSAAYLPAIDTLGRRRKLIACHARISGRGAEGTTANLGVFLKLPPPDEALDDAEDDE